MFIAASTRPNSTASANWRRERPASDGRVTAHSTMLAVSRRSSTAPPGPTESNSFVAIADAELDRRDPADDQRRRRDA